MLSLFIDSVLTATYVLCWFFILKFSNLLLLAHFIQINACNLLTKTILWFQRTR